MQGNQQQHQTAQQTASPDERLLAHLEEINFLREQVEFLREMVESQNLHLHDNEQKLQEVELELRATNQDLCTVLSLAGSSHFSENFRLKFLAHLTLIEAKELAKTILKSEKLKSESLAELLTAIYNEKVEPEELKQVDRLNIKTNPLKKELKTHRKQLEAEYKELSFQFVSFKALYTQSRKRWNKLLTITKEKN